MDNREDVAGLTEVHGDLLNDRVFVVFKIDRQNTPYGARQLVHQSARFVEIDVLSVLSYLRDGDRIDTAFVVKRVENPAEKNFDAGGRRQS